MTDLSFEPPTENRRPRTAWLDEQNTRRVQRSMLEGVASGSPEKVVAMVTRARVRGASWATIAAWLGPRQSCPPHLHAVYDRVMLLAFVEARLRAPR